MTLPLLLRQAADPPPPGIVIAVAAKNVVRLVDDFPCEPEIKVVGGPSMKAKKVGQA